VRSCRFVVTLFAMILAVTALAGVFVPSANALGAQVYRTDQYGSKTGTVTNIGDTGPDAFCTGLGIGAVRYGVAVCYLPL